MQQRKAEFLKKFTEEFTDEGVVAVIFLFCPVTKKLPRKSEIKPEVFYNSLDSLLGGQEFLAIGHNKQQNINQKKPEISVCIFFSYSLMISYCIIL